MPKRIRVVSKKEYAAYIAWTTTLGISQIICYLLSLFFATCSVALGGATFSLLFIPKALSWMPISGFFAALSGFSAWALFRFGHAAGDTCIQMEPVEPMTRHNIGQLPAEETLVRASQEPPIAQEKVLLRAAQPMEETKPEELLRPTS